MDNVTLKNDEQTACSIENVDRHKLITISAERQAHSHRKCLG